MTRPRRRKPEPPMDESQSQIWAFSEAHRVAKELLKKSSQPTVLAFAHKWTDAAMNDWQNFMFKRKGAKS